VQGADVVRWQILGVFLQVVSWPLGYALIAKGKSLLYTLSQLTFGVINVVLILLCMKFWGLEGVGIAFAMFYVFVVAIVFFICWRLTGFHWSATALKILAPAVLILVAIFVCTRFLPERWSIGIGLAVMAIASVVSLLALQKLLGVNLLARIRSRMPWAQKGD
jgi:antigen flippase